MKILATLIIGVALLGVASCDNDQSEPAMADEQPIREQTTDGRRRNSPEVVLQLKYDGGELNRIYLTQFRKLNKSWDPSVGVQTSLCEDLCHAGRFIFLFIFVFLYTKQWKKNRFKRGYFLCWCFLAFCFVVV